MWRDSVPTAGPLVLLLLASCMQLAACQNSLLPFSDGALIGIAAGGSTGFVVFAMMVAVIIYYRARREYRKQMQMAAQMAEIESTPHTVAMQLPPPQAIRRPSARIDSITHEVPVPVMPNPLKLPPGPPNPAILIPPPQSIQQAFALPGGFPLGMNPGASLPPGFPGTTAPSLPPRDILAKNSDALAVVSAQRKLLQDMIAIQKARLGLPPDMPLDPKLAAFAHSLNARSVPPTRDPTATQAIAAATAKADSAAHDDSSSAAPPVPKPQPASLRPDNNNSDQVDRMSKDESGEDDMEGHITIRATRTTYNPGGHDSYGQQQVDLPFSVNRQSQQAFDDIPVGGSKNQGAATMSAGYSMSFDDMPVGGRNRGAQNLPPAYEPEDDELAGAPTSLTYNNAHDDEDDPPSWERDAHGRQAYERGAPIGVHKKGKAALLPGDPRADTAKPETPAVRKGGMAFTV